MSDDWKSAIARRPVLAALGALAGVGAVGGIVHEASHLFGYRPHPGPYDDLISLLSDRGDAVTVGRAVVATDRAFRLPDAARELRAQIGKKPLAAVLGEDLVQGRVVETEGWVLPQTLVGLCALAAEAG
ncbi:MAG TPA: hypothetical protein VLT91_02030 [Rhizomicrobium sp.]|nr:hypothetical protein [Rhizomicrobium sp.]